MIYDNDFPTDEVVTGGPMTLNPISLKRRNPGDDKHTPMDHGNNFNNFSFAEVCYMQSLV